MDLEIEELYDRLSIQKYYEGRINIIEETYLNKDKTLISIISKKYDKKIICNTINKWIDKLNKKIKNKWYGFAHKKIEPVCIDSNIVEEFNKIDFLILKNINEADLNKTVSYIYIYCGFDIYFENFEKRVILKQEKLINVYDNLINDTDFIKWNLIPISDKMIFKVDRIFDLNNKKTIHICLDTNLLKILHKMIKDKIISKISFRSNDIIEDGLIDDKTLCEGTEKGVVFDFNQLNRCNETKLYSNKNYNDQLWVFTDDNSITFEELLDDYDFDDDSIITQMIHIEYFYEHNIPYISHIDKENIFYTVDEYTKRKERNIKGNAKKREKFFKINESKINFDYPCPVINYKKGKEPTEITIPFIYFIVKHFFKNSDNVDEYFSKLSK
ncbi:MAG: hypothetical protein K6E87_06490 [bacterium]|nr:hypothetical protein [bacterium]